jgi:hypothetical protein
MSMDEVNTERQERNLSIADQIALRQEQELDDYEPEQEVQEEEVIEDEQEQEPEPVAESKYKLKVNGVEKELSVEEILRIAQKVESADAYLEQAKRQLKNQPSAQDVGSDEVSEYDDSTQTSRAGNYSNTQTQPSTDVVQQQVWAAIEHKQAVDWFKTEYEDVVSDPFLQKLVIEKDNELRESGYKGSLKDRYKEAGESVREWLSSRTRQPSSIETKAAKKDRLPNMPKAASTRADRQVEEVEETPSQIIARMARERTRI